MFDAPARVHLHPDQPPSPQADRRRRVERQRTRSGRRRRACARRRCGGRETGVDVVTALDALGVETVRVGPVPPGSPPSAPQVLREGLTGQRCAFSCTEAVGADDPVGPSSRYLRATVPPARPRSLASAGVSAPVRKTLDSGRETRLVADRPRNGSSAVGPTSRPRTSGRHRSLSRGRRNRVRRSQCRRHLRRPSSPVIPRRRGRPDLSSSTLLRPSDHAGPDGRSGAWLVWRLPRWEQGVDGPAIGRAGRAPPTA